MPSLDIRFAILVAVPYATGALYIAVTAFKAARWAGRRAMFHIRVRRFTRQAERAALARPQPERTSMNRAQLDQLAEDLERYRLEHIPQGPDQVAVEHAWNVSLIQLSDRIREEVPVERPAFLITADDTLTEAEAEQLRADVQITPRPLSPAAGLGVALADIAERIDALLDSRILCTACAIANRQAAAQGATEDQLPPMNPAQLIVPDGTGRPTGSCLGHVQIGGPALPGQTPNGLYLPGAGA